MNILTKGIGLPAAAMATAVLLSGCADENPWGDTSEEKGKISLTLTADTGIETSAPVVRSAEGTRATGNLGDYITLPGADDFSITLEKKDGGYSKTWATLADFKTEAENAQFNTGAYTLTANYGKKGEQGLGKPYFEASQTFTVLSDQTSNVSMTAELQNSLAVINYTDAFSRYMDTYTVHLRTEGNAHDVTHAKGVSGPVFIEPATTTLSLDFKTTAGKEAFIEIGTFAAVAKTLHNITLDVKEPEGGDATLTVTFPESDGVITDPERIHVIEIPLTDEALNAAAPEITCVGFENGATVEMLESTGSGQTVKMEVKARGIIKSAILTVQADNGQSPAWGPGEVDLCSLSDTQQAAMVQSGIEAAGFFKNRDVFGILDLTGFGKSMKKGRYTISLSVADEKGQTCEPAAVVIDCQQIVLSNVSAASTFASEHATLTMDYNGSNPATDVTFKTRDDMGNFVDARVVSCEEMTGTRSFETKQYVYTIEVPVGTATAIETKALHCGNEKGIFSIPVTAPEYSITQVDAFSRYAYLKISNTSGDAAELAAITKYLRVKNGSSELKVESRDEDTGIVKVTGLSSDTNYNLSTHVLDADLNDASWRGVSTFTTEKALSVPNGDFENLTETINTTIQQGGQWTITTVGGSYSTTLSMVIKEPAGWYSSNTTTCDLTSSNLNSWYVIPSVYNTKLTWNSNQPEAKVMGIGQSAHTTTADIYQNLQAYNGSNAMVVRNVAWDKNGAGISTTKQTGDSKYTNYYGQNKPSIANRTAGYLKLGSATSDGTAFSSRPSKLKGYFKYERDSHDSDEMGVVTVKILSGSEVIGTGKLELGAQSQYTDFTVPITYISNIFNKKASSLQIEILSSNRTANIQTTDYCNKEECCSRGAALTIDNLTFEY